MKTPTKASPAPPSARAAGRPVPSPHGTETLWRSLRRSIVFPSLRSLSIISRVFSSRESHPWRTTFAAQRQGDAGRRNAAHEPGRAHGATRSIGPAPDEERKREPRLARTPHLADDPPARSPRG